MSIAELPPRTAEAQPRAAPTERFRFRLTLEQSIYLALFALALLAHFWGLGDRAYHHDESHHAYYSWRLYQGMGYVHDPLLHGPFLYFINAFVYFLFGDTNTTARISVAVFGSALVLMPYMIRRELGRGAALVAALYLTISPVFLYVGRFIRHDPFAVAFELLAFVGLVRYVSTRRAGWLYLLAAALGLMSVTMESFFLYVALMLPLVAGLFLWYIWKPGLAVAAATGLAVVVCMFVLPGEPQMSGSGVVRTAGNYVCPTDANLFPPGNPMQYTPGPVLGLPPLATADNNYGLCVRHQPDNSFAAYFVKLGQFFGHPAVLMALAALVLGAGATIWMIWFRRSVGGDTPWQRARAVENPVIEAFASLGDDRRLWIAAGIFFAIYALFFSAFLTNPVGIVSGMFGSVLYWLAQHNVQRGGQPLYYYAMELSVYEPLLVIWSLVGVAAVVATAIRVWRRGMPHPASGGVDWWLALPAMLLWWSAGTFAVYSWAGEKMPWLTMHVALPLVLLASWALVRIVAWAFPAIGVLVAERRRTVVIYLAVVATLAVYTFLLMSIISGSGASNPLLPAGIIVPGALLLIGLVTLSYALLRGFRESVGALALATVLLGGAYTLRSSYQLNYLWSDTPREMMIFVQSTPDVANIMERLEQASIRRTGGMDMPIWYDNETIWNWYTRRFTNRTQQQPSLSGSPDADVQAVLMLQDNISSYPQNRDKLAGFVIQRLPMRWWFPEDQYRLPSDWLSGPVDSSSPLLLRMLRMPLDNQTSIDAWRYFMYRIPPGSLGSTDFVIAVRPDLASEMGLGTGATR